MKKLLTALLTVALFCAVLTAVSGCEHEQETALQTEQIYSLTACTEHEFGLYLEEKSRHLHGKGHQSGILRDLRRKVGAGNRSFGARHARFRL